MVSESTIHINEGDDDDNEGVAGVQLGCALSQPLVNDVNRLFASLIYHGSSDLCLAATCICFSVSVHEPKVGGKLDWR